jgi:hypothetical protein
MTPSARSTKHCVPRDAADEVDVAADPAETCHQQPPQRGLRGLMSRLPSPRKADSAAAGGAAVAAAAGHARTPRLRLLVNDSRQRSR